MIQRLFALMGILKIVGNKESFLDWLENYRGISREEDIFNGYLYFIECILRASSEEFLIMDFGRNDDIEFVPRDRLTIEDIPNTCDTIIFLKNFWLNVKKLLNVTTWEDFDIIIFSDLILEFEKIYGEDAIPNNGNSKNGALIQHMISSTFHEFNNIETGVPNAFEAGDILPPILSNNFENFKGYTYTLEYLWYSLFGKETFENSAVSSLMEEYTCYGGSDCWKKLDSKSFKIKKELDSNILWFSTEYFEIAETKVTKSIKNTLKNYFNVEYLSNPDYFEKNDEISLKKRMDYYFKWRNISPINGYYDEFRSPLFVTVLLGLLNLKQNEKINVIRFKHPTTRSNEYWYSYAVRLMDKTIYGDSKGWVVVLKCGNNFSGHAGGMHRLAEYVITGHVSELSITEVELDEKTLEEYLFENSIYFGSDELRILNEKIDNGNEIEKTLEKMSGNVIITEGKTDWKHMDAALNRFREKGKFKDLKSDFLRYENDIEMGHDVLYAICDTHSKTPRLNKIICIFDNDNEGIVKKVMVDNQKYKIWKNKVYSFAIPLPKHRNNNRISIEHYYKDEDIKKMDKNGRRLYMGSEFRENYGTGTCDITNRNIVTTQSGKCGKNHIDIIDNCVAYVGEEDNNIALSKNNFANYIKNGEEGFDDFDISAFEEIFKIIEEIEKL
ncbi:hypothetical protein HNP86_001731 [Methanococcus maripaludis]|uniref:Uncharacterized protein n=1 Tax=Methanococcus maripaludis TaxID=39152 RepID=A0A7J9NV78_METMI|nr:hypothetical protein [Methanococcus maripaludis]MBA2851578.1 hypothetical protein [Methanococcus maripaludis]